MTDVAADKRTDQRGIKRNNNGDQRRGRGRGRPRGEHQQPTVVPISKTPKCFVCHTNESKYKCPTCRAPYCSMECCQQHKQIPCQAAITTAPPATTTTTTTISKSKYLPSDLLLQDPNVNAAHRRNILLLEDQEDDDLDDEWKITRTMMDSINQSTWLQQELQDGGLRQIIHEIMMNSNKITSQTNKTFQQEALLGFQQKYPNFRGFVDKLLVTAGVVERQLDASHQEELSTWLLRAHDDLGPLALVPLPTRKRDAPPSTELRTDMGIQKRDDSLSDEDSSSTDTDDNSTTDSSDSDDN